jgi:hypothetical protein
LTVFGTVSNTVNINFNGCAATARFQAVLSFGANSGAYTGSSTLANMAP